MVSAGAGAVLVLLACLLGGGGSGGGALAASSRAVHGGCPVDKFDCNNGKCISGSQWCDGIDNCGNNADELSCRICLSGSIKCKASNQCVASGARCNGKVECQDGSDEFGCDTIVTEPTSTVATNPQPMEVTNSASNKIISFVVLSAALVSSFFSH